MDQVILVPSQERRVLALSDSKIRTFKEPARAVKWLEKLEPETTSILGIMGGPSQTLFTQALHMGFSIWRVPMFKLQELTGLEPKASPKERAEAIRQSWEMAQGAFYQMEELDPIIGVIRELTRQRLNIQDFRKPATNQLHAALRELEFVLPPQAQPLIKLLKQAVKELFKRPETRSEIEEALRRLELEVMTTDVQQAQLLAIRRFFANPRFILGAKEDEEVLEERILRLLPELPIWPWLSLRDSVLPPIKGLGPSLGGSIVSEIGDIRRFPSPEALRAYARFHVTEEGKFPYRQKGEVAPWNRYLNRAVWLWSTDQMPRYDHPWRFLYDWKKARELQAHPNTTPREVKDKRGRKRTVWDYTLKHLDSRAKRWVGSQMLNYLWEFWWVVARNQDPRKWYPNSTWPEYFERLEGEILAEGLDEYLEQEIPKRRRVEPKEAEEVEETEEE